MGEDLEKVTYSCRERGKIEGEQSVFSNPAGSKQAHYKIREKGDTKIKINQQEKSLGNTDECSIGKGPGGGNGLLHTMAPRL